MAEGVLALREQLTRVLLLDSEVFAEVAADPRSTGTALTVVFGVACMEGLGRMPCWGIAGLLTGVIESCLLWGLAVLAVHAAALLLGERSEFAPLLRALGFAAFPFAAGVLDALPLLGVLVVIAKWALGLAAAVCAVQRVIVRDLARACLLCGIGLAAALLLSAPVRWLFDLP